MSLDNKLFIALFVFIISTSLEAKKQFPKKPKLFILPIQRVAQRPVINPAIRFGGNTQPGALARQLEQLQQTAIPALLALRRANQQ